MASVEPSNCGKVISFQIFNNLQYSSSSTYNYNIICSNYQLTIIQQNMWNREYKEITQIRSVERCGCICK